MRSRLPLLAILLAGISIAAPHLAHAAIPYWGPIIPSGSNVCPLGWNAIIIVANNIISFALTFIVAFILPLLIAYSGFLYLTSGANPGNRSRANSMLTNTLIGLAIALGAWLIVDSLLSVLYNSSTTGNTPWYSLITTNGSDPCIKQAGSLPTDTLNIGSGATVTGIDANGNQTLSYGVGSCDSGTLQQAYPGISVSEANTLACLAKPESSCGQNTTGATTQSGQATSAAGPFQIVFGYNDTCHNLNVPQCEVLHGGQPLNCSTAFSGGKPKSDAASQTLATQCINAANNLSCATAAADCLVKASNGYSAWTADSRATAQQACITANAGG